jgi:hypothetical protein
MKIKTIVVLSALGLSSACGSKEKPTSSEGALQKNLQQEIIFDRLLGLWKNEEGSGFERWTMNADGSYFSVGFRVKDADTLYTERVHVHQEGNQWVSENTVTGQNEGKAIKFAVSQLIRDEVHFSNPAHDFPTDIHYRLTDVNTITAYIAGPNETGGKDTIPFQFKRIEK